MILSALLFLAAGLSAVGRAEPAPSTAAADSAVTLTPPPALAVEAPMKGRSDAVTAGWSDQRPVKARARLGLAVVVGLAVLLAAAVVTSARPLPARRSTLWRRSSVALRAPPRLRLS